MNAMFEPVTQQAAEAAAVTAEDLRWATAVAEQLQQRGHTIHTAYHNGRRMVMHIDRDPQLSNTQIGMVRRTPLTDGYERVFACSHLGVQIQWVVFEPAAREVKHG
jgi:hypothetical protein